MPDSAAIKRDLTIANACDEARNIYCSSHMNAAVARLIAKLVSDQPPATIHDSPREYLERLASLFDDVIENVASECGLNGSYDNIVSVALHDSDLPADLTNAAETIREDMEERTLERV